VNSIYFNFLLLFIGQKISSILMQKTFLIFFLDFCRALGHKKTSERFNVLIEVKIVLEKIFFVNRDLHYKPSHGCNS
jgi:hypothetical protein